MSDEESFHTEQDDGYDDDNPYLPRTPAAYQQAWADLEGLWGETLAKAQTLDEEQLHESVDGEWSFIQTLRHLAFASDLWVFTVVQGDPDAYDPLDLPWDTYGRFPNPIPYERDVKPPLADVLALRSDRVARVRAFLDHLTQERIESVVEHRSESWPFDEDFVVGHCLSTVVNEEWHHRTFAERDLDKLLAGG